MHGAWATHCTQPACLVVLEFHCGQSTVGTGGLVAEYNPATVETRVRFPVGAARTLFPRFPVGAARTLFPQFPAGAMYTPFPSSRGLFGGFFKGG
jgi:hypothetical protein